MVRVWAAECARDARGPGECRWCRTARSPDKRQRIRGSVLMRTKGSLESGAFLPDALTLIRATHCMFAAHRGRNWRHCRAGANAKKAGTGSEGCVKWMDVLQVCCVSRVCPCCVRHLDITYGRVMLHNWRSPCISIFTWMTIHTQTAGHALCFCFVQS